MFYSGSSAEVPGFPRITESRSRFTDAAPGNLAASSECQTSCFSKDAVNRLTGKGVPRGFQVTPERQRIDCGTAYLWTVLNKCCKCIFSSLGFSSCHFLLSSVIVRMQHITQITHKTWAGCLCYRHSFQTTVGC